MEQVNHTRREEGREKKKREVRVIIPFNRAATLPDPFGWQSNNNDRYLPLRDGDVKHSDGTLEFTGQDPYKIFTPEVSSNNSGCVNIKHSRTNLYLTRAPYQHEAPFLIVATAKTPNENRDDKYCTLFELLKVGKVEPTDDTPVVFRMRHVQSNRYLRPHNFNGLDAALCAFNLDQDPGKVDFFTSIES